MPGVIDILKSLRLWSLTVVLLLSAVSCQTRYPVAPVLSGAERAHLQREDAGSLEQLKEHNLELQRDFLTLKSSGGWRERGYFSAQESDELESLLFRYHAVHGSLLEIAHRNAQAGEGGGAEKLRVSAHRQILAQAQFAVDTFAEDDVAIDKLNQRYPRSEIPARTYDHLVDVLQSGFGRRAKALGQKAEDQFSKSSYELQAKVFFRVSRFKSPRAHLIHFNEDQKHEVLEMLEPGDIILSYTSGYASSFFIPGEFKHAMVYVGTVEDRQKIGLVSSRVHLPGGQGKENQRVKDFVQDRTVEGRPANMIEAIAEGVKFSNLEYVMDTHINRLLVIRPQLTRQQRILYLSRVFSYLGQEYDFEFDFADASRQVCTELVYRALNGIDGIEFELSHHAGRLSMTADDMIHYWLKENPGGFQFVLFAKESALSVNHTAKILTGEKGERELKKLVGLSP